MSYLHHNETKDHSATAQIIADAIDRSIASGEVVTVDDDRVAGQLRVECEHEVQDEGGTTFHGVNLDGEKWGVRVVVD